MTRRWIGLAATLLAGCGTDDVVVPRSDEPAVYLVLTRDSLVPADPSNIDDARLTAVVATTGVPWAFEFRQAESFVMRRASDGSAFAWSPLAATGPMDLTRPYAMPLRGNYVLEETPTAAGLGRRDLRPGVRYTLSVSTGGRVITGQAVLPDRPQPVFVDHPTQPMVSWPRAAGAAMYVVSYGYRVWDRASADTFYVLPRLEGSQPTHVRVMAVDENWAAFYRDQTLMSAGITGGNGLFGATAEGVVAVSP